MKKLTSALLLLSLSVFANAQDWCGWSFQYKFKIENGKFNLFKVERIEISVNSSFESRRYQGGKFSYDDSTASYSMTLNYGCISCGYFDALSPSTLYFKVDLTNELERFNLSIIIPVTFDQLESARIGVLDLGTLFIEDFIFINPEYSNYAGIRVKSDGTIYKYKKGEYGFPAPEKLYFLKQDQ